MSLGVFSSIGEYYRHGPYRAYARECRSAGRTPVDLVRVSQPAGSFPDPPLPALSLFLVARGVIRTRVSLGDRPFTRLQTARHVRRRPARHRLRLRGQRAARAAGRGGPAWPPSSRSWSRPA